MPKGKGNDVNMPGWLSAVVSILVVLSILFVPLLTGNWIQKVRSGEGRYAFQEELCFDISQKAEFDNSWVQPGSTTNGGMMYLYRLPLPKNNNNQVQILTIPKNDTVDGYSVSTTIPNAGDVPVIDPLKEYQVIYLFNFTKTKILNLDITRIDIFLEIAGVSFSEMKFSLTDLPGTTTVFSGEKVSLGNLTSIDVSLTDLLTINTLTTGKIKIQFSTQPGEFIPPGVFVVFDMQWYCIKEIKTPSLTQQAFANVILAFFIFYAGIVFAPEYTVKGTMGRFLGTTEGRR